MMSMTVVECVVRGGVKCVEGSWSAIPAGGFLLEKTSETEEKRHITSHRSHPDPDPDPDHHHRIMVAREMGMSGNDIHITTGTHRSIREDVHRSETRDLPVIRIDL